MWQTWDTKVKVTIGKESAKTTYVQECCVLLLNIKIAKCAFEAQKCNSKLEKILFK